MTSYIPSGPAAQHPDTLERKRWCEQCGRFLAKHIYKDVDGDGRCASGIMLS